jgi:predicted AAA+ superfamily ATPase
MGEDLFPRHLSAELEVALAAARVVNVIGPRQTGKTTLVRDLFHSGRFVTLDNPGTLAALRSDALGQLQALAAEAGDRPVIVDEAQRWKPLALAIKQIVDADRRKGQFILTGSSNVFTTAEVGKSPPMPESERNWIGLGRCHGKRADYVRDGGKRSRIDIPLMGQRAPQREPRLFPTA